ncbi:glycerol-3-phosphate dehydrogenase/oxidase [Hymenobacter cellulosivorans]|uniref:Glycerol-3-phosphate dehydrogenase/oxidase n=1 Tax=Hymenobacter cellulosivorans TaxID=2932249 RepID=A0ABY4FFM3_9BACT|nr:glycerol-3-phosphate dehydrogenase/oxidase [Hymenobacter cellulosivorans]UOQ55205.1 glycerol-3-phosphate dehydrogenase/oxidase [Hymenobacter cellulosivorans]
MSTTPDLARFRRDTLLAQLTQQPEWDLLVIGGGATGLGVALDAVSRGYRTLLLEQADFAKGTSSRSTKLVHGGVRYLAQGDIGLVREALYERGLLLQNAPHLVKNQDFIIPNYSWWGGPFYTLGLKMYDLLAGRLSLGASRHLSKAETLQRLGTIKAEGLRGGVLYHDGQFDDARLAVNLAQTVVEQGGTVLNHVAVTGLRKNDQGRITGATATDQETGTAYEVAAKVVVNATGVFVDDILQLDTPGTRPLVRPSQGVHIVLDKSFLPGDDALMIPKTEDGRVLFAVPWHGRVVVGTTDTPLREHSLEPRALDEEIEFILRTAGQYLTKVPRREDALSVFAGLRPLAAPQGNSDTTKEISRSHKILVSKTGLVTITGGKWTTYRRMGQDTVDRAIALGQLPAAPSQTVHLPIHGAQPTTKYGAHLSVYGTDQPALQQLMTDRPELSVKLDPALEFTGTEVVWGARAEMARTVEDVLARRVRVLFLDAAAAVRVAPRVAELLAEELGKDAQWQARQVAEFEELAQGYLLNGIRASQ